MPQVIIECLLTQMCELRIAQEDAHANYVNTINGIKEQHEAQLGEMRAENSSLSGEVSQLKYVKQMACLCQFLNSACIPLIFYSDQIFSKERKVTMLKEDLDSASNRLSTAESKCLRQKAEMAAKEE